jgi:hypothetical protein
MTGAAVVGRLPAMPTRRRLPLLLALAALAAGATAQPSSAALHQARFLVKFEGTEHTTWNLPKYQTAQDCYRTRFFEAGGDETWHVGSLGEQKLLVHGNGAATQYQIGSWQLNHGSTSGGLLAHGQLSRSHHETPSLGAGTCGVTMKPLDWDDPVAPLDCGTRLLNYEVNLGWNGKAAADITPDVVLGENGIREKTGFDNCPLARPENVPVDSWPPATGHIMSKGKRLPNFWGKQKELVATGRDSWTASTMIQTGKETSTVTIDWKLTFTRVGGAK